MARGSRCTSDSQVLIDEGVHFLTSAHIDRRGRCPHLPEAFPLYDSLRSHACVPPTKNPSPMARIFGVSRKGEGGRAKRGRMRCKFKCLRRPYSFCSCKKNMERKTRQRGTQRRVPLVESPRADKVTTLHLRTSANYCFCLAIIPPWRCRHFVGGSLLRFKGPLAAIFFARIHAFLPPKIHACEGNRTRGKHNKEW